MDSSSDTVTRRSTVRTSPISHERLAVLLALAEAPASCAMLSTQAIADSTGSIYIKPSSLYRLLHELLRNHYITEDPNNMPGPTVYDLTSKGWNTLENELARIRRTARLLEIRLSPRQHKSGDSKP